MPNQTKDITIRINKKLKARFKAKCKREGTDMSKTIKGWVKNYLNEEES